MGKCGVNIGVRSEFEGKIQFMTQTNVLKPLHIDAQPGDFFGFRPGNSSKNGNTDSQDIPSHNEDHRSEELEDYASDIYESEDKGKVEHGLIFLLPFFLHYLYLNRNGN